MTEKTAKIMYKEAMHRKESWAGTNTRYSEKCREGQ